MSEFLVQAFADWRAGRLYIDGNGNYHLKADGRPSGPIAPYNRALKAAFSTAADFHTAAHGRTPTEAPHA